MNRDSLGDRMKENYENRAKTYLARRIPVAIRLDMKAGHTFTRGFKKPFDHIFMESMQQTMKYLCENIQGCLLGYTQSDEITLILQDYKTLTTDAWFDYAVQKICSISASMATMQFNKVFANLVEEEYRAYNDFRFLPAAEDDLYIGALVRAADKGAMFDSRCFNIPKEEITNLILWRQKDAERNSINMVGQAYFSYRELQGKSLSQVQDMLMKKYQVNWNDFTVAEKRGACCKKVQVVDSVKINAISVAPDGTPSPSYTPDLVTTKWIIDGDIPIFVNEGRNYIEDIMNCEEK